MSGHQIAASLDPESPSHLSSISVPRPLGLRGLLDRWYLSCQQTAWMVISIGGSISSIHTLTSHLSSRSMGYTSTSITSVDHTERNLYIYILAGRGYRAQTWLGGTDQDGARPG